MIEKKKYNLGTIELSDSVVISDPCYDLNTWCIKILENIVKPGRYLGFMKKSDFGPGGFGGIRVTDLWVVHEDHSDLYPNDLDEAAEIGVDSGAAGIYDLKYYNKYHQIEEDGESGDWYDNQFELRYNYDINGEEFIEPRWVDDWVFNEDGTISNPREGHWEYSGQERRDGIAIDNKCVISFSGFGDGGYSLYTAKDEEGKIIGIRIEFIPDDFDEEDEE